MRNFCLTAAIVIMVIVGSLILGAARAQARSGDSCKFAKLETGTAMVKAQVCNVTPGQTGDVVVQVKTVLPAEVVLCFDDGGPLPACSHIANVNIGQQCLSFTISWPAERVVGMDSEGNLLFAPMPSPQWVGLRETGGIVPYALSTLSKSRPTRQYSC